VRRRSVPDFPPKCLGFIFCEIFSNLVATGCRRGRTPERPLRQPPRVRLIKPGLFHARADRVVSARPLSEKWVNQGSGRFAQVATCVERREAGFT